MRTRIRRYFRRLVRGAGTARDILPEGVAARTGKALRRGHMTGAVVLVAVVIAAVLALQAPVRRAGTAMQAALIAARQPGLALHLGDIDLAGGAPEQSKAFAETLAALTADQATLNRPLPDGRAPIETDPALAALYAGPGYTLNARLADVLALARSLRDGGGGEARTQLAADLGRELREQVAPRLEQASARLQAVAMARLHELAQALLLAFAAIIVMPLLGLLAFIPLDLQLARTLGLLEFLAARDALTGALTGGAFAARLHRLLLRARPQSGVAVLEFDLDNFQSFNATNGDAAGDAALRAVARRLQQEIGNTALVARLGSDSFAVAVPGITGGREEVAALGTRLSIALRLPVAFEGQSLRIAATGGSALAPQDSANRREVLRMAGVALREAKRGLKGVVHGYHAHDAQLQARREAVLQSLSAGDLRGIEPWLQPIVRAGDLVPVRFEVLARWEHPVVGRVSPAEFIPIAEAIGRLPLLSAHVRNLAFTRLAELRRGRSGAQPGLSLNFAASELTTPQAVSALEQALAEAGLSLADISIEVPDVLLVGGDDAALQALQGLRAQGARLSLDNFGAGLANLAQLHRFQVDGLKISRDFVAGIGNDTRAETIMRGLIGLGRGLGIETVVQGVETPAELEFARGAGADLVQGYLIAAPMATAKLADWMRVTA